MKSRFSLICSLLFVLLVILAAGGVAVSKARASALPQQSSCTNQRVYLGSSSVPAVTAYDQGQQFAKVVNYQNSGSCTWNRDYRFVMISRPEGMGGRTVVRLPHDVPPGEDVRIEIDLYAPDDIGTHEMKWQLQSPDGYVISQVSYDFKVEDIKGQVFNGLGGFNLTSNSFCEEHPTLLGIETIPDVAALSPGQSFSKVLRYRNDGAGCIWNEDYRLVNSSEDRMSGPRVVWLDGYVRYEDEVTLTIPLVAPTTPGEHSDNWQLQTADGSVISWPTISTTVARPQQPAAGSSSGSNASTSSPASCTDEYKFIKDVTIADGTVMEPGERFTKIWRYRNEGTCTWGDEYQMSYHSGPRMGSPYAFELPQTVRPGETVDIAVSLVAPTTPGKHKTRWMLHAPDGDAFAITSRPFVEIVVD